MTIKNISIKGTGELSGGRRGGFERLIGRDVLCYSASLLQQGPSVGVIRGGPEVARSCDICGKRPVHGNQISHAHNVSSRVWYPNVQRIRVVVGKTRRRMRVCTRCLRSGAVVKAASARPPSAP